MQFFGGNCIFTVQIWWLSGGRLFRSTRSTRSDWTLRGGFLMIFQCFFYPKSVIRACGILKKSFHVLMTDLELWLGRIWVFWLLLLGLLGGEFLFVVFEVFA